MRLYPIACARFRNSVRITLLLAAIVGVRAAAADDIPVNVSYVCNGEHIYVENCNMRDTSDTSTCMVAHPDHLGPTGMNTYTYLTRGALRQLLPTCQQPSAQSLAAAKARQQKLQQTVDAQQRQAEASVAAPTAAQSQAAMQQATIPKDPAERQMNRCISSGRLPSSCTGNALLSGFSSMMGSAISSLTGTKAADDAAPKAGMTMSGAYAGAGSWRIDFITDGVLVNCSFLSPNQETYSVKFAGGSTQVVINTTPKPLVLTLHPDGTMTAPGPVTINGVVASGYHDGKPSNAAYTDNAGNYYDMNKNKLQSSAGYTTFSPKTATCPALNLSTKGAGVGIETMETNVLKSAFGGDTGQPTPAGIRMEGIYAASTGFSVQFFPESVILGCGPDSARAYPYTVEAGAGGGVVKVNATDHPLTLAIRGDNTLDPGSTGTYQVHGRLILGENDNGDYSFTPYEQTCGLAMLAPSKAIPATGGTASMTAAMAAAKPAANPGTLSMPDKPLGNAVLSIISGLQAAPGQPNPLAGRPLVLLRQSYGDSLASGGVNVPAGTSPYKYASNACGTGSPECPKISQSIQASAASAVRADATGKGTLPGVPPGTYYLMVSALYNQKPLIWGQAVQIHAGQNTITLDQTNATPVQ